MFRHQKWKSSCIETIITWHQKQTKKINKLMNPVFKIHTWVIPLSCSFPRYLSLSVICCPLPVLAPVSLSKITPPAGRLSFSLLLFSFPCFPFWVFLSKPPLASCHPSHLLPQSLPYQSPFLLPQKQPLTIMSSGSGRKVGKGKEIK